MDMTPIAYKCLPHDVLVKRLACSIRAANPGYITKAATAQGIRARLGRGSKALAERVGEEICRQRRIENARLTARAGCDPYSNRQPLRARLAARTADTVMDCYELCGYRRARGKWAGGEHEVVVKIGFASATAKMGRVWASNGKWSGQNSIHIIEVPPNWLSSVYRNGLAVIDNRLVLAARPDGEGSWRVTFVHQGAGTAITTVPGRVSANGKLRRL